MKRRVMAFLLAFALMAGLLPLGAAALEDIPELHETHINPLYKDSITEEELTSPDDIPSFLADAEVYHETVADAAVYLRECMEQRVPLIAVGLTGETLDNFTEEMIHILFDTAVTHTGEPTEGDYLLWQYGGWDCSGSARKSGTTYYMTFTYTMTYYTTAEQEQAVSSRVGAVLEALELEGQTDYGKIRAVYEYITENVTYDYDNLYDDTYKLKHTAYAALMDGTAVCQGYALLLYRFALELGIDCRLISGTSSGEGHGWNIIKIGNAYYNADSTWDAGKTEYDYFLVANANFPNHLRDSEYIAASFCEAYPISDADFTLTVIADGSCGDDLNWVLTSDGTLTISGTGEMTDYSEASAPWSNSEADIHYVLLEEGIAHIGTKAFSGLNLSTLIIPSSVLTISDDAFLGCDGLEKIVFKGNAPALGDNTFRTLDIICRYPSTKCSWTSIVLNSYGGTILWIPYDDGDTPSHAYDSTLTPPSCTEQGYMTHICTLCGYTRSDTYTPALGHDFGEWKTTKDATCIANGEKRRECAACDHYETDVIKATGHKYEDGKCTVCGEADPDYAAPTETSVIRLAGADRFDTAFKAANELKAILGVEKFDSVVVASGAEFADALAGSYLAAVKSAPILLSYKEKQNEQVKAYIRENLAPGGTVYILGGTSAVPSSMEQGLEGFEVIRLAGADRFETNLLILKEAGVKAGDEILVCTGKEFADSLSASATGKPILLVYKKLTNSQMDYLKSLNGNKLCIVGGESAVPIALETAIKAYGETTRLAGKDRLVTSVMVAQKYFSNPDSAVVAYGWNYPDGLCGGPLAYAMDAPLILTYSKPSLYATAANYTNPLGIKSGYILGGTGLVYDEAVRAIFSMAESDSITAK